MKSGSIYLLSFFLLAFVQSSHLKSSQKFHINIDEPSDIALSSDGQFFYIVSDKGSLYKTNLEGKIIQKSGLVGTDFEAVCVKDKKIYVVDERYRYIYVLDESTMLVERKVTVPYSGGRNSGYEGICWNQQKKKFVLAVEKSPVILYELDENLRVENEIDFKASTDISSVTYAQNYLWILSEEDHCIFKTNPSNYAVIKKYNLKVVGAEGVAFDNEGKMYITSDGMALLYKFDKIDE
ncbi:MAG: SdiA-regulated domain-containing protein [Bacteroidetes bacterium]|nr:SdiA-regulated domain-containing protein [Bacteroidota bacterium]